MVEVLLIDVEETISGVDNIRDWIESGEAAEYFDDDDGYASVSIDGSVVINEEAGSLEELRQLIERSLIIANQSS